MADEQPDFDQTLREIFEKNGMQADPDGSMASMAITVSEIYSSFIEAGFSEPQSLYLAVAVLTGTPGTPPPR